MLVRLRSTRTKCTAGVRTTTLPQCLEPCNTCTVSCLTQDLKCTSHSVYTQQGLGRHTTVREGLVEQAGARELTCQSQQTRSPSTCVKQEVPMVSAFHLGHLSRRTQCAMVFLSNCNGTHVVFMSSQVLQTIRHIVGLIALCTATRTLSHNTLHVGVLLPFLMATSRDSPVIWDVSVSRDQQPSVNFMRSPGTRFLDPLLIHFSLSHTIDPDSLLHDDVLALIIMLRDTCLQFR